MALKSYKSKAFTIKSKKVNKEIFNRGLNTFDNIAVANFGYNKDNLTQDDLFMAMRLKWTLKETGEPVGYEEIEPNGDMSYHVFDKFKDQWADIWDKINTCTVSYYTETPYVALNN